MADKLVRVGIIGTGWGSRVQVPAFRAAGLTVTAICGAQAEKTAKIAQDLSIPFHTADYNALVAHPEVDIVMVVTPPRMHAAIAVAALNAGKHVVCDKPTALNTGEAELMVKVAGEHPAQLSLMDHELRLLNCVKLARETILGGKIGTLRYIDCTFLATLAVNKSYTWWSQRSEGGGILGAIGSHLFDLFRYVSGAVITDVHAQLDTLTPKAADEAGVMHDVTSDDYCSLQMKIATPDGAVGNGTLLMNTAAFGMDRRYVVFVGSAGSVILDLSAMTCVCRDAAGAEIGNAADIIEGEFKNAFQHATVLLGRALKQALTSEKPVGHESLSLLATFPDGLYEQKVIDAVLLSKDTKARAPVTL